MPAASAQAPVGSDLVTAETRRKVGQQVVRERDRLPGLRQGHSHIDGLCHILYKGQTAGRGVAFVGSDAAEDVVPSLVQGLALPLHTLLITGLGMNLLDNQDLEAVAVMAAKHNRWVFMLTIAPLAVKGGTGSPANIIATS